MKRIASFAGIIIAFACVGTVAPPTRAQQPGAEAGQTPSVTRSLAAEPNVIVDLRLKDGRVSVSGWERGEVRLSSFDAEQIESQRRDGTTAPQPVKRIHFNVVDRKGTLTLQVPRGATVLLFAESAAVSVEGIAKVRVEDGGGRIDVRGVAQVVEASSITGGISVRDSGGRIQLRSVSGVVEVTGVRPAEAGDVLHLFSVSGDFLLDRVSHAQVEAETTTGSVTMTDSFAPAARYDLKTTTGNVTITLPGDASFQVRAGVAKEGKIVNDFGLELTGEGNRSSSQQLVGTRGTGEAMLRLSSFSGVIRLKRKS
jgi:DUF4097 and DUF4098 domain-containing protein YvlB